MELSPVDPAVLGSAVEIIGGDAGNCLPHIAESLEAIHVMPFEWCMDCPVVSIIEHISVVAPLISKMQNPSQVIPVCAQFLV